MPDLNEARERDLAFEAWAMPYGLDCDYVSGPKGEVYIWRATQVAFSAWKAGRSSAQQVEAVSIDSPEFWKLASAWASSRGQVTDSFAKAALIQFIDTKLRQAATGSADGLERAELSKAMLAIPCKPGHYNNINVKYAYMDGHEDARRAAAALVLAQQEQRHE